MPPYRTNCQQSEYEYMKIKHSLKHWSLPALCGLAGWVLACPLSGQAATSTNVNVSNAANALAFFPPTVTINVSDQVTWIWQGTLSHSTTDTGVWDSSPLASAPHSFPFTFANAGTFPYHCANPFHTSMMGSVIVLAAANTPPTVTITNPPAGTVLSAPATITLAASASDSNGGSVTNVQFFQGLASLANVTSSPYSVAVNNLGAADYTFSAVATDNGGLTRTNAITVHVVTPVPVILGALQRPSPTSFQFSYSANVGLQYVVQRSGDLLNFTPINTNTAASNPVTFLDNGAAGAASIYRVGRLPNP
jgi:plastocyanin